MNIQSCTDVKRVVHPKGRFTMACRYMHIRVSVVYKCRYRPVHRKYRATQVYTSYIELHVCDSQWSVFFHKGNHVGYIMPRKDRLIFIHGFTAKKVMALVLAVECVDEAQNLIRKRRRRWWVRPAYQRRIQLREFNNLLPHLHVNDPEMYFKYLRMSPERYNHLLSLVSDNLIKLAFRECVSASERLTITLVYLAAGCSQQDLSLRFHRGRSTISNILSDTCDVLYNVLSLRYLRAPENEEEWEKIAQQFWQRWNFPNCIGCIDGKHFNIQCPKLSGSQYYNYKHFFSSLVLAMCDAECKFIYLLCGSSGREGDAGVFGRSDIFHYLEGNLLHILRPTNVAGTVLPYVVLGDEAFPLKQYLMRPYPGRGKVTLPYKEQVNNHRPVASSSVH